MNAMKNTKEYVRSSRACGYKTDPASGRKVKRLISSRSLSCRNKELNAMKYIMNAMEKHQRIHQKENNECNEKTPKKYIRSPCPSGYKTKPSFPMEL